MPPSDGTLPLPRSCDRARLRLLRGWILQPPARRWMREVILLLFGFFFFKLDSLFYNPELLFCSFPFDRCQCNPIGSASKACHPTTGQCVCRAGVEGTLCDSCRLGFFGFSSRGCRGTGLRPPSSASFHSPKDDLDPPLCVLSSPSL